MHRFTPRWKMSFPARWCGGGEAGAGGRGNCPGIKAAPLMPRRLLIVFPGDDRPLLFAVPPVRDIMRTEQKAKIYV